VIDAVVLTVTVTVDGEARSWSSCPCRFRRSAASWSVVATPAVAVTFAVRLVDRILVAMPCEFVLDTLSLIDPRRW
jgi:hypothetical protein